MSNLHIIFVGNDMALQLDDVRDQDGAVRSDAVVVATLTDQAGAEITGQTWPLTLAFVPDTGNNYRGILSKDLNITPRDKLVGIVTAVVGGRTGEWTQDITVSIRRFAK